MRKSAYHETMLGSFALPPSYADQLGFVTVHESPRYALATDEQLQQWADSRIKAVRAAALTQLAQRAIADWRASN